MPWLQELSWPGAVLPHAARHEQHCHIATHAVALSGNRSYGLDDRLAETWMNSVADPGVDPELTGYFRHAFMP